MWSLLDQLGIHREDCILLPLLGDGRPAGKHGKVVKAQLDEALPEFRKALAAITADVVIPMGTSPLRAVTGLQWEAGKVAGYVIEPSDCVSVPMKQYVQVGMYVNANKKIGRKAGDPKLAWRVQAAPPVLPKGCQWIVPGVGIEMTVRSKYQNVTQFRAPFKHALSLMGGDTLLDNGFSYSEDHPVDQEWRGDIAYDLETTMETNLADKTIKQASLSGLEGTWTFPWDANAVASFKAAMTTAGLKIAHNEQFDIPILKAHGIEVPEPQMDTMLAAAVLEPDLPKALIAVAPMYLLLKPWKHIAEIRGHADPFYNAKDSFVEWHLAYALNERLEDDGMYDLFHKTMMPAVKVLMDMKEKGIRVNSAFADKWCTELAITLNTQTVSWVERHPDISPSSHVQIKKLVYDQWGIKPIYQKGTKKLRTDEYALRRLAKAHPEHAADMDLLRQIHKTQKMLGTFGRTSLGIDRVHPSYLPASKDDADDKGKGIAGTGRLAAHGPNIQQMPKEARYLFVPDTPDMCFIEFDWSQAELRVAAALSNDKVMLEALKGDIHGYTMKRMGCDRTRAKNTMFGSAYGGGPGKLKEELEGHGFAITFKECKDLQTQLAETYPTWWAWRESVAMQAEAQQYLRNPFGRLRRFPVKNVTTAMNYLPQSTVADMAWECYLPVWETAKTSGGRLTTAVHDSFLIQTPDRKWVVDGITNILERTFDQIAPGFTCPVSIKVGKPGASWAELEDL